MGPEIDQTLAAIQKLSARLAAMADGPERAALEAERERLRAAARLAADMAKPVAHLKAELANISGQLESLREVPIKPALNESYKMVTDPSAYRRRINASIAANEAPRIEQLETRLEELREALRRVEPT